MSTKTRLAPEKLYEFMHTVFRKLGVPEGEAETCADVLQAASLKGIDTHGIARLKSKYFDRINRGVTLPETEIEKINDRGATALFDANHGMGMVASKRAMRTAIDKAQEHGLGMTTVTRSTHYGIAGYWAEMATEAEMIGLTGTNARPSVAPTFGVENMLGTNPLTIGVPTDEEFPFLIDCATSLIQRGKIEEYAREDKELEEGWVVGEDGESHTDPHAVLEEILAGEAALTPLGGIGEKNSGYKGYGYATAVELISAALTGANFLKLLSGFRGDEEVKLNLGHFFIAIDVSFFREPDQVKETAGKITRRLRDSKKDPDEEKIYTAWEKEYLTEQKRREEGVPLLADTVEEMKEMAEELDMAPEWQEILSA